MYADVQIWPPVESLTNSPERKGTEDTVSMATRKKTNWTWRANSCRPPWPVVREDTNIAIMNRSALKRQHPNPTAVLKERTRFRLPHPEHQSVQINKVADEETEIFWVGTTVYCEGKMKERTDSIFFAGKWGTILCCAKVERFCEEFCGNCSKRIKFKCVNCFIHDLFVRNIKVFEMF